MSGDLTAHFSRSEFDDTWTEGVEEPTVRLLGVLENLRAQGGNEPLYIVSGYRAAEHNAAVGGAAASRHLLGDAADLDPGRFTLDQAVAAGATGVGLSDGWVVHVDCRPGDLVTWEY